MDGYDCNDLAFLPQLTSVNSAGSEGACEGMQTVLETADSDRRHAK